MRMEEGCLPHDLMEDLSLHILDVAENAITAGAENISIVVQEDVARDLLTIEITDDGKGMGEDALEKASDPFYTTRTTRKVGLGLALLKEAAAMANGQVDIRSAPNRGTTVRATFQLSHIDRKPLGKMADTITALLATRSDINISYRHEREGGILQFDTKELKRRLDGLPLNTVRTLSFLNKYLNQEEDNLSHHV
jgi:anti-sigma regulatory factor (Ser/Thr protein kinase)